MFEDNGQPVLEIRKIHEKSPTDVIFSYSGLAVLSDTGRLTSQLTINSGNHLLNHNLTKIILRAAIR